MTKQPLVCALMLAFATTGVAAAQDRQNETQLDDLRLPGGPKSVVMTQVPEHDAQSRTTSDALQTSQEEPDRSLSVPAPPAQGRDPLPQPRTPDDLMRGAQLSGSGESRQLAAAGISSRTDSKPGPAGGIAGNDRCDPQADRAKLQSCERILERRAAEFQAAEAPRLTAEQALLAQNQSGDRSQSLARAPARSLDPSASDPDADLRSNQELAAIYLDSTAPPDLPGAGAAAQGSLGEALVDVLNSMQVVVPSP